jgi:ZIP family zinc transporter
MVKAGIVTAIAIGVHNFPEGVATFMATMSDTTVGVPIAIAVAIHNIPEGIAVAVPIYFATNSRAKAFKYSFLSGLSEPVGALAAWLILMPMMTQTLLNVVFAVVAGIMVYISIDELLPSAEEYGQHHLSILGVIIGMALMAASLILL